VATEAQATRAEGVPQHYGRLRHTALASFWFGQFFLWQPIGTVLIQHQVDDLVPRSEQGTALGVLIGCGGFVAMALPPVVGAWSDRLSTRFGRRRPIIVAGTLGTTIGLAILFYAHSYAQLLAGYMVVQVFFNGAGAAYAGLVPDVVPGSEFGRASGYLATMVQLGSGAGLAVTALITGPRYPVTYLVIAGVILLSVIPTVLVARREGREPVPALSLPHVALLRAFQDFLRPLWTGDFGWVVATRLCTTAGINTVAYFLFNFFRDVVRVKDPGTFTPEWFLVVLITAVPCGLAAGVISDRAGRKPFVYASGALQSLVALVYIVFFPTNQALVFAVGAIYGIGYGCYYAVDWALACDTLPDRASPAKDMGLFHVAFTLPQTFVPALAGIALDHFNRLAPNSGYRVVFSGAVVFLLLGTLLVSRIRSIR
jgi:MFS family permease